MITIYLAAVLNVGPVPRKPLGYDYESFMDSMHPQWRQWDQDGNGYLSDAEEMELSD